jgi:hypothetical protein
MRRRGVLAAVLAVLGALGAPGLSLPAPAGAATVARPATVTGADGGQGYYLATADGGVFAFGTAPFMGSMAGRLPGASFVGITEPDDAPGYYLADENGGVYAFGGAPFDGSLGGIRLAAPIVAMVATEPDICPVGTPHFMLGCPTGGGYYLVGADGGVFAFGDAPFFGSLGDTRLDAPIVDLVEYSDCHGSYPHYCPVTGYSLIAADGGIFTFGDIPFDGSLAGTHLTSPVVDGSIVGVYDCCAGYTLVTADGAVYTLNPSTYVEGNPGGAADPYEGSLSGTPLVAPVTAIMRGTDYDLVTADGGVFTFGTRTPFYGSLGGDRLAAPVVGGSWYEAPST